MKRRNNHLHSSPKVRAWASVGWLAMALLFGVTGWLFAIEPLAVAAGNWQQARDYQSTTATVAQRTGKDAAGEFNWYVAQYRIGERLYETTRLTVLDDEDIDETSNELVLKSLEKAFKDKQPITVWVSPRKPEVAIVSRDLPLRSLWGRVPTAIVFSIFAIAGVMGLLGCLGNFTYYRRMVDSAGHWLFSALWCGFIFPMLIVVARSSSVEWIAAAVVGFFALIGALILYGAVAISLWGARKTDAAGNPVNANSNGAIKRGGFGGRGDDFDKD
jgi:DNA-binding transcriptional regulator of glucitol operon